MNNPTSMCNYAVLHFGVVRSMADLVERRADMTGSAVDIAVVFAAMSIEALAVEQALLAVVWRDATQAQYNDADGTVGYVKRIQALLNTAFNQGLDLGRAPGQDLRHIVELRDGLVHFKYNQIDPALRRTLVELAGRSLFDDADARGWPLAWPNHAHVELVLPWIVQTTSDIAMEIADMSRFDGEADRTIRKRFSP